MYPEWLAYANCASTSTKDIKTNYETEVLFLRQTSEWVNE